MLSEEIFDFGKSTMNADTVNELKLRLNEQFMDVFNLCKWVLENAVNGQVQSSLVNNTLITLQHFLSWMPLGYIFQFDLMTILVKNFMVQSQYQMNAMSCLAEVACIKMDNEDMTKYQDKVGLLFFDFCAEFYKQIGCNLTFVQA